MTVKNTDIVAYFQRAVSEGWGYVWSMNGELYTKELAEKYKKIKRKTSSKSRPPETYWTVDCAKWIGKMAADCSGGIVGAIRTKKPSFGDKTANTFKSQFAESGKIDTIPEIPGLAVWRNGHIGIYEGNGYVLEFRGTDYGAVRTKLKERNFTHWGKISGVDYEDLPAADSKKLTVSRLLKLTDPMQKGDDVKEMQSRIRDYGIRAVVIDGKAKTFKVDGTFGPVTEAAVKAYQKSMGLAVDGKAGKKTISSLGGVYRG